MNAHSIGANKSVPKAGGEVSIPLGASSPADLHYTAIAAQLRADGSGTGPRCIECRRNVSRCLCDAPEPEQEHFKPGSNYDPDAGWAFAERCAFGMGVSHG